MIEFSWSSRGLIVLVDFELKTPRTVFFQRFDRRFLSEINDKHIKYILWKHTTGKYGSGWSGRNSMER